MHNSQTHASPLGIWIWRPEDMNTMNRNSKEAKLYSTNNKDYNTVAMYPQIYFMTKLLQTHNSSHVCNVICLLCI